MLAGCCTDLRGTELVSEDSQDFNVTERTRELKLFHPFWKDGSRSSQSIPPLGKREGIRREGVRGDYGVGTVSLRVRSTSKLDRKGTFF